MTARTLHIIMALAACLLMGNAIDSLTPEGSIARAAMQESDAGHAADEDADAEEEDAGPLVFDQDARDHLGITLVTIKASTLQPEIHGVGIIEADPALSFTVRAPIAGYLRTESGAWPGVGATLGDHAKLGAVQPRLTPLEQFALANQYVEAKASLGEIEAELAAAEASYQSKRELNAEGKLVSDRQFEEAEAKLMASRARLAGAKQKVELLESQRSEAESGLAPLSIEADSGGRVVDVLASPGEAVESGQPLLRVARFNRLIARIELPLGQTWNSPEGNPRIAAPGGEAHVLPASTIGPAPRAGRQTRGQAWLLSIDNADNVIAPGSPVIAYLPVGGKPLTGVLVPDSAILRYAGLAWVFVRGESDTFERRPVQLHTPTPDGWFVTGGLDAGTQIVEHGAQVLLSEQLKAQIEAEEEASE